MKLIIRILFLTFIIFTGCDKLHRNAGLPIDQWSFRDVPGITEDEIIQIEALKKQYTQFTYGILPSTEGFVKENGEIGGFSILFSQWLSGLFGIPFEPVLLRTPNILELIERGEVDFSGDLRITEERRQYSIATGPIALRSMKMFRMKGSEPIERITPARLPRYAFIKDTVSIDDVAAVTLPGSYETVLITLFEGSAYELLKHNEVDAFIALNLVESHFEILDDIVMEDFFPLIFSPVSLLTGKPELSPIISVVQKVLDNYGYRYFNELYEKGYEEYRRHKLSLRLTDEEKEYLSKTSVVPFTAGHDYFPVSFYNKYDKKWEGSAFDILSEVANLTGLTFEIVNDNRGSLADSARMLLTGEAFISPALIYIEDRKEMFLWSQHIYITDKYAILSKRNIPNISIDEIPFTKIGLIDEMGYSDVFKNWFPQANNTVVFETTNDAINGLKRGEIDLLMATTDSLIVLTNYYEQLGYKANFIFNSTFDISFGFNRDQHLLRSIFDKAFLLIDADEIVSHWKTMTYDHQSRILRAQRPWLISAICLTLIVLVLVFVLFVRSRSTGKHLEKLVRHRTGELEMQSSLLETMIDSIPDIVFCKDLNLNYTLCNKSMEEFFGLSKKSIIGKNDIHGLGFSAETVEKISAIDLEVINEKKIIVMEEWMPSKDRGNRLFETVKVPLKQNGSVTGIVAIAHDITDRKAMEEEALSASRSKSAFLANMSHEIRTPLNVVIGLTDLVLEENNLSKNAYDNLHKINNAGNTLLSIVNDILDFSKIESGKLTLMPAEYHVSSLLNDIITLMNTRIGEKPIIFTLNINDDLPAKLFGDDLRIKQIFNNLLSNAIKYTEAGNIELTVNVYSVDVNNDPNNVWMEITVRDTGIGITEENMEKLFVDYYQVENITIRKMEGTGLGLSITRKLVEMMGGKITAESKIGKGTIFRTRILQRYIDNAPIGSEIAGKLRKFRYAEDNRLVSKKLVRSDMSFAKVLVVDDMQTNLDVAAGLLGKYKMQIDCVLSGQEAVERIRLGVPVYNAIFMDHMMPGMDGIETAIAIRNLATEYARKIPIIALTANAIHGTEDLFFAHDFQAFLSKPIDIMQMDSILRKWISPASASRDQKKG